MNLHPDVNACVVTLWPFNIPIRFKVFSLSRYDAAQSDCVKTNKVIKLQHVAMYI